MSVTVYAPASIGNVSVGFDVLGAAVKPIVAVVVVRTSWFDVCRPQEGYWYGRSENALLWCARHDPSAVLSRSAPLALLRPVREAWLARQFLVSCKA